MREKKGRGEKVREGEGSLTRGTKGEEGSGVEKVEGALTDTRSSTMDERRTTVGRFSRAGMSSRTVTRELRG